MNDAAPIGVLVMAYGTAAGPDDIERYYTDIRGGRAPSPEHLQELKERYAAIGNVFPLLDTTRAQAEGLVERLNGGGGTRFRAYLGMKHSPPFITDGVEAMRDDGIERGIGIVMAPHWSGMSVESYVERVAQAVDDHGETPVFTFVRSYHDHPAFIAFLTERVREALGAMPGEVRDDTVVIFSAHSLPVRTVDDGTQRCKYLRLRRLVPLPRRAAAYRRSGGRATRPRATTSSRGRAPDEPPTRGGAPRSKTSSSRSRSRVIERCSSAAPGSSPTTSRSSTTSTSRRARSRKGPGSIFARTRMPNADPVYLDVLAEVVRDHMATVPGA